MVTRKFRVGKRSVSVGSRNLAKVLRHIKQAPVTMDIDPKAKAGLERETRPVMERVSR
jgi:hypothetical protein